MKMYTCNTEIFKKKVNMRRWKYERKWEGRKVSSSERNDKRGERGWRWSCWSWLWKSDTGTPSLPFSTSQLYHPRSDELQNVSDMADIKRLEGWGKKCGGNAVLSIKDFCLGKFEQLIWSSVLIKTSLIWKNVLFSKNTIL